MDELLARYGLRPRARRRVAATDCEVWRLRMDRGPDLALRLYPPRQTDARAIETELTWLAALHDAGLHVPCPLADRDGLRLQRAGGRFAVLLTWLGGRMHHRGLTPARLRWVGRFTGQAHRIALQLQQQGRVDLRREAFPLDLADWAAGTRAGSERLGPRHRALLAEAAALIAPRLAACGDHQLVHGDLHPWNLLFVRGAAGAIDFSDCGRGPPALDLAATLQHLRHPLPGGPDHRPQYRALHDALLDGYAAEHTLPRDAPAQVELLLHARGFGTLEWMLDDWQRLDERAWGPAYLRRQPQVLRRFLAATVAA